MDTREIFSHIDHTLLKATASFAEIRLLCEEAVRYQMASVCIPASYVKRAKEAFPSLPVCTVIGFPLGYSTTSVKVCETKEAIADGASEIDMVINLGDVKNHEYAKVLSEIQALRQAAKGRILKVIVETCYLTKEEKIALCKIVTEAGADFIKTSTGFGTGGAVIEDVGLFKEHIGSGVKIKAAGGIRTREDLEKFLEAGCERIGTSSALKILLENGD